DPEVPCLLMQVDAVESAYQTRAANRASRFARLQQQLLRTYPAEHVVTAVRSSSFPIFGPEMVSFRLDQLAHEFEAKQLGGTLYIPKASHASCDEELVRQVFDPQHLHRI